MKAFTRKSVGLLFFLFWFVPLWGASTPLFWKAAKDGKTVYLLGTIHVGSDDLYPLPDVVYDAMEQSKSLFVEVDLRGLDTSVAQDKMDTLSAMSDASLFDLLDSDTWFALDEALDKYQMQLVKMDHKQPWYFVYLLSGLPAARGDFDPELGVDFYLMDLADRDDVPVKSLETLDFQLTMFSDWSMEEQITLLKEFLTDDGTSMDSLTTLHDAWRDGDESAIMAQEESSSGDSQIMKAFWNKLIDQRNHSMLKTLLEKTDDVSTAFVAVGTMHMVGEQGLVKLLENHGYTVSLLSGKKEEVAHD